MKGYVLVDDGMVKDMRDFRYATSWHRQSVVQQRNGCESQGQQEAVQIALPPMCGLGQNGQHGDGSQQQHKGQHGIVSGHFRVIVVRMRFGGGIVIVVRMLGGSGMIVGSVRRRLFVGWGPAPTGLRQLLHTAKCRPRSWSESIGRVVMLLVVSVIRLFRYRSRQIDMHWAPPHGEPPEEGMIILQKPIFGHPRSYLDLPAIRCPPII